MLSPNEYLTSIHAIDLDELRSRGVDTLLVDIDNTVLPRNSAVVTDELRGWIRRVVEAGITPCLVSNNFHDHVYAIAEALGCDIIAKALKPLPFGFMRALKLCGSSPRRAAVVGDQVFTDVLGGNLLGMRTILVVPLSSSDLPHTVVLRALERLIVAGRQPLS